MLQMIFTDTNTTRFQLFFTQVDKYCILYICVALECPHHHLCPATRGLVAKSMSRATIKKKAMTSLPIKILICFFPKSLPKTLERVSPILSGGNQSETEPSCTVGPQPDDDCRRFGVAGRPVAKTTKSTMLVQF